MKTVKCILNEIEREQETEIKELKLEARNNFYKLKGNDYNDSMSILKDVVQKDRIEVNEFISLNSEDDLLKQKINKIDRRIEIKIDMLKQTNKTIIFDSSNKSYKWNIN